MSTVLNTSITPQFRTIDGLKIRCAESEGGGHREPTVLLTSPWPESVYAFAPISDTLSSGRRRRWSTPPSSSTRSRAIRDLGTDAVTATRPICMCTSP
jgi:hypothetical protein